MDGSAGRLHRLFKIGEELLAPKLQQAAGEALLRTISAATCLDLLFFAQEVSDGFGMSP